MSSLRRLLALWSRDDDARMDDIEARVAAGETVDLPPGWSVELGDQVHCQPDSDLDRGRDGTVGQVGYSA
ncbi:MAG: hypothetical protein ACWA5A_09355 [Marinibacterium sp.]